MNSEKADACVVPNAPQGFEAGSANLAALMKASPTAFRNDRQTPKGAESKVAAGGLEDGSVD